MFSYLTADASEPLRDNKITAHFAVNGIPDER